MTASATTTTTTSPLSEKVTCRIREEEVIAAQKGWGNGIVEIGAAKDPIQAAKAHIDKFYAFDSSGVLFKPTLAAKVQFRTTKAAALSYFVGGEIAEDGGFALTPFVKVRWENEGIIIQQTTALAMGNYFFTNQQGDEIKVEFSFSYIKDDAGQLKITLHHSSVPYNPAQ
ncbi:hypothetical protein [Motilimonas pumila]|uniref:Phosphoribosyl-AMP cyclohydrolase n=1 Tax=Motilimonas pumila TaxID=2303987 RepID=A0A418YEG0_9GAMM|nr:hypothetical protein [Motilimonas pumila]RJG47543.1 hypothetical protein D1Z90_10410 [Motilimonas pumila]